ncbi:MAG: N-acetyl-gamma-glutamyl-phosphate reductase [Lentisphaeria bacterium]|nr:N-acetyl-gamma-glutamyl-phosphate reductase [Lentisphaeria bacterium]
MRNQTITVAVFGASGYSGEELLRILLKHRHVTISAITSRQYAGQPVSTVFPRFAETGLQFSKPDVEAIAEQIDVAFLSLPHGLASEYAEPLLRKGVKVIDISADFRLRDITIYEKYYACAHPAPDVLKQAVYGLPEIYRATIKTAQLVACAGCYPTSIIVPAAPLLAAGLFHTDSLVACSMSGVSGAGRKVDLPYIFPECNESIRPYGVVGHRHLPEIEQELTAAAGGQTVTMNFIPHLAPVNRGIHSTIILRPKASLSEERLHEIWRDAYGGEPFVRVLPLGELADTKHVTLSNMVEIGLRFDPHTGNVVVSSAIDNLTKGAAGQAVQCMNLVCGLPETTALDVLG